MHACLYVYVCRWKDKVAEEAPHANNGMKTMHQIAIVDVALCLTLLLVGVLLLVQFVCLPEYPTIFNF